MAYRIQNLKPKLRKTGKEIDASGIKPALSYDSTSDIIMFREESWVSIVTGWVKTSVLFALSAALILSILYIILAATLMFITPVDGKLTLVARGTFLGGNPSIGEVVLASSQTPAAADPLSKIKAGVFGLDNAEVVKVESDASASITVGSDKVTLADGTEVQGSTTLGEGESNSMVLKDQLLVRCIAGSCEGKDLFILDKNLVYGEVQNYEDSSDAR